MAGHSREPHGTPPSSHQCVVLTAVNDQGVNPARAGAAAGDPDGAGDPDVPELGAADCPEEDGDAAGADVDDVDTAEPPTEVDTPQPASTPTPSAATATVIGIE